MGQPSGCPIAIEGQEMVFCFFIFILELTNMNAHYILNEARKAWPTFFGPAPKSPIIGTIDNGLDEPREVTEEEAIANIFNESIEEYHPKEDDDSEYSHCQMESVRQCKELLAKHWLK